MTAEETDNSRALYYYQSLVSLLEPDLGRGMAVTTLRRYCEDLGIEECSIAEGDIDELAGLLEEGLANFVGRPRLESLILQIKKIKEYDDWGIV